MPFSQLPLLTSGQPIAWRKSTAEANPTASFWTLWEGCWAARTQGVVPAEQKCLGTEVPLGRARRMDSIAPWIQSWSNSSVCVLCHFLESSLPRGSSSEVPTVVTDLMWCLKLASFSFLQCSPLMILYASGRPPALSPHLRVFFGGSPEHQSSWTALLNGAQRPSGDKTWGSWCQEALWGPGVCPPGTSRVSASTYPPPSHL